MAEHPCNGGRAKGYSSSQMDEYKHNAEFNPRAASSAAADHTPWPVNNAAPVLADHVPNSAVLHAAPKWWVSPSHGSPAPAVFGAAACLPNHGVDAVDHSRLSVHDNGAPALVKDALHFAADLSRNNPYLDAALRSPSASWRQMQQQQVNAVAADDWSCNGAFSARNASYSQSVRPGFDQDVFHPSFSEHSAYPVLQPAGSRAPYNFPQFTAAHRPLCTSYANMMNGDGNFKFADEQYGSWGSTDQVRNVAKSQSMRALYEENAALRRALVSMRRGSLFALQGEQMIPGEQDRCIAADVAEGRALSMRERGRWAMQAAGEVVAGDGNCSMWASTPRQPWAAGPPLHGIQAAAAGTHRRQRTHPAHNQSWEEGAAEHPSFYGGGGGPFGGWPEDAMGGNREYPHWVEAHQNECGANEAGSGEGTSLKQLLVESDRAGSKWRRQGKKKPSRNCEEVVGKQEAAAAAEEEEEQRQCAMCGGKLRNVEVGGGKKGAGLPLRLCPACHPRAAASLPHSTTPKSPPLTAQTRHHVATAILMACRPNTAASVHGQDPKYATNKKPKPKNRIVDLCRHFVGLAAKPPPPA